MGRSVVAMLLTAAAASSIAVTADDQCGVYLAESTQGRTLGSFAGKQFQQNELVGSADAVVQVLDVREYNDHLTGTFDGAHLESFLGTCWSGDATAGMSEGHEVVSAVGGPCFSSVGHVGLINAVIYQPSTLLRTDEDLLASGYDELTSPGRGAFTAYHNLTLLVSCAAESWPSVWLYISYCLPYTNGVQSVDKIPPGMEIFLDFGAEYNQYENVDKPNIDDYIKMDEAIEKMVSFFDKHAEALGEKAATEVFEFMKKDVLDLTAEARAPAARSLLPETYHGLREIVEMGGSALHSMPEVQKSIEFLKSNGYCQDNIVSGVSSIEHAGRGAFAARPMRKGEVVAAMPLVALHEGRSALNMIEYEGGSEDDSEDDDGEKEERVGRVVVSEKFQLLLNYMLEHPESSTLFFPAGGVTPLINHGGKKANVKMIWSTKSWSNVKETRELRVEDLSQVGPIDMILELVATRPLNRGEEILMDYGDRWDRAFKEHVRQWEKTTADEKFVESALTQNNRHHNPENLSPFPLDNEQLENENLDLVCHLLYDEEKIERRRNEDGTRTKIYPWIPHPVAGASRLKTDIAIRGIHRTPCVILERTGDVDTGYKYLVEPAQMDDGPGLLVKNVPHYAIRYIDKPYTSPQNFGGAFRHPIAFPDKIFPQKWRNLKDGGSKDEL